MPHARSVAFLTCIALVACSDAGPDSASLPEASVRDSAGVTIVENARLPEGAVWTLSDSAALVIGVVDGDPAYQLFRVRDATRLPDGRIAVLNGGTSEVRVYSADGTWEASWGGQGDGPGEFMNASGLGPWPGDSLAVWDGRTRRLTILADDGLVGRTLTLSPLENMDFPTLADVLDDGRLVVTSLAFPTEPRNGRVEMPVRVAVTDASGSLLTSLGEHPGDAAFMTVGDGGLSIYRNPYSAGYVLAAAGDRVVLGGNARFELPFYTADGTLSRIVRLDEERTVTTEADGAAELERRLENVPPEGHAGVRTAYEAMPLPDTLPAIASVMVDRTGHLWVERFGVRTREGPEEWIVLDPEGRAVSRVHTPDGATLYEIGDDYVLGRVTDELGVEQVRMWRLDRGR